MTTPNNFVDAFHTLVGLFMSHTMREMEHFARQNGLTMAHFGLLMRLHYHEPFIISDISDHLGITPAAASQMVQRMVEQGLIDRVEDPNDRRIKRISLTAEGKRLVNEVIALRRQWMETIGETLPEAARDQIVAALTRLNDTIKNIGSRTDAEHDK